jgi:hypothetical protein
LGVIINFYFRYVKKLILHIEIMIDKCDRCGMDNVEVMTVKKSEEDEKEIKLCNQCRPADGAYAY